MTDATQPEIVRSIVIGIGGTGCKIVNETKKRINKVCGDLPIVQYLVFDTDSKKEDADMIEDAEFVRLTVEHADDYIKSMADGNFPELKSWWIPDLRQIGDVTDGARQIRPIGRFALFRNIYKIRNVIRNKETYIMQENRRNEVERAGYSVGHGFNVYIVNSVGGGTGGGMFLDIACNVRDSIRGCKISGYTILPDVFAKISAGERSDVAANSYAALKELDYYMDINAGHLFSCDYGSVKVECNNKPFDYYHIIDSRDEDNDKIINDKDVIQAIANMIFLDLASPVGRTAGGIRNNIDLDLRTNYVDPVNKKHVKAYSSSGLYSLYYPVPEIKDTCSYRYAVSLVDEITRPVERIDNIVDASLNDITTRSEIKLEISDLEGMLSKKYFEKPCEIDGIEIENIKDDRLGDTLTRWIAEEEKRIDDKISLQIKDRRVEFSEKIRCYLTDEVERVVEDSSKGLAVGKEVIDKLDAFVLAHLEELSEGGVGEDVGQITRYEKGLKELKEVGAKTVEGLQNTISAKLVLFRRDKIKKHVDAYLENSVTYLTMYLGILKDREIKVFYIEVLNILSEIRADLDNIEKKLGQLKEDFAKDKELVLHQLHTESGTFQLEKWVGGTEENIESIYSQYGKPPGDVKKEVCQNILYDWKDYDIEVIRTALLRASEMQYANVRMNIIDVLPDLDNEIKRVISNAHVQMMGSGAIIRKGGDQSSTTKTVNLLGVPAELQGTVDDIVKKVAPPTADSECQVVATSDDTRITNVIYKYITPLIGMEPITRMKNDYEAMIERKARPLHIIDTNLLEEIT